MKTILSILVSLLPLIGSSQTTEWQAGDLLFVDTDCGPMCDAIKEVTQGYDGQDFSHVGMLVPFQGQWMVYEAIGAGVVKTPLDAFFEKNTHTIYKGRLKSKYQSLIPMALQFCEQQLGLAYDDEFIYNNGKYYCSELIYDAFKYANANRPFFRLFPMTYKQPNSKAFFPIWVSYFKEIGKEIPEGKPGCNPGVMSQSDYLEMVKVQ